MPDIYMDVDVALAEVPVNIMPLIDDTDFKTRETAVAYNAAGMDLVWNFTTSAGVTTQTPVTPTTGGSYDWTHQGDGMYTIEIPASGGASINNDTEGVGFFTGIANGVLPWRGPTIGFRAAAINDALCDGGDFLDVNVEQWNATNVPAEHTAGYPIVTIKVGTGTGELSITSGRVLIQSGYQRNAAITAFSFQMTDSTNHNPQTGFMVAVQRKIDGGSFGAGGITNITDAGLGVYTMDISAADMNGGTITFVCTASGADQLTIVLRTDP